MRGDVYQRNQRADTEIYGFEVSAEMVSKITDKILPEIEEWQKRPLGEVYPIVFIDAIHFSVKNDGIVGRRPYIFAGD